jgi:pimeloyl-ACP methyl ester carboxylesterase
MRFAMALIVAAALWLATSTAVLALAFHRALSAAWREPVLRAPVLILESDDWGYGPPVQAERLDRIAAVLARFRDALGSHPVTTLGVVLGGPDTARIRADHCRAYHRMTLTDPRLAAVREAMLRGAARGVFALQLHAMEHFWPACMMRRAAVDGKIRRWLTDAAFPATEELPSELQSRWIDATELPSVPLPMDEVMPAATTEVDTFTAVFGAKPEVVVPPTFVWDDTVESAWARAGARVVVTPGVRNESRDANGRIVAGERTFFNAETGPLGVSYVVRDCYLEPSLGVTHQRTLEQLRASTRAGRPTLVEMHRLNFLGDEASTQTALDEVRRLLEIAQEEFPTLRFMSTATLARECRDDAALVERRIGTRVHLFIRRLASISRLRKLAWATGAAIPAWLIYVATRPRVGAAS